MKLQPPVEDGSLSPIQSFLQLERYNGIQLVQKIHENLAALSKVIRGISLITNEIQEFAKDLLQNEVRGQEEVERRELLEQKIMTLNFPLRAEHCLYIFARRDDFLRFVAIIRMIKIQETIFDTLNLCFATSYTSVYSGEFGHEGFFRRTV